MRIKVGCLQFNPLLGKTARNADTIRSIIRGAPVKPDLLVLPELAVTGYNFGTRANIEPFLEERGKGPSSDLARELSLQYECFTLIGYPESEPPNIYNSAILVAPDGSTLHHYRKTHLYSADEDWGCSESPEGFSAIDVVLDKNYWKEKVRNTSPSKESITNGNAEEKKTQENTEENNSEAKKDSQSRNDSKVSRFRSHRISIGICMDLNPYQFKAPFTAFEFSLQCLEKKADLVLCPMAWLLPDSPSINESLSAEEKLEKGKQLASRWFSNDPRPVYPEEQPVLGTENGFNAAQPSTSTIDYWILRFYPFLARPLANPVTMVACNRTGVEGDTMYGGSLAIWEVGIGWADPRVYDHTNGKVDLKGAMGAGTEGLLVREIELGDGK